MPMQSSESTQPNTAVETVVNIEAEEIEKISKELQTLNAQNLLKLYNFLPKLLFFQFMKGLAFGFGSVVGATLVVSFLAYILSQVEFVPIVGDWIKNILSELEKQP